MIVRRCWSLILLSTGLILYIRIGGINGERWSRQVSNSDWIPLANPRSSSSQIRPSNSGNGPISSGSPSLPHLSSLSLPPALQEQYQQQLLQLQKTQENIQKLLILQEQLRTQQQLLQSQTFLPSGFSSPENDKRMLQQNTIPNLSGVSGLSSDVLVPPLPSSDALPPIYSAQNFLSQGPQRFHQRIRGNQNLNVKSEEFGNSHNSKSQVDYSEGHEDGLREGQSLDQLTQVEDIRDNVKDFAGKQEKYRPSGKQVKGQTVQGISGISENAENENEEVQLVYVPIETLAQQRVQPKRFRGQKQYPFRQQQQQQQKQQQYRINDENEQTTREPDTFGRDFLDQLKFAKEERSKEVARIEDVEKALERKAQLEQEILQKEQELAKQKEEERRRKELEKIEEITKQRELERLREVREKQRLEELERRRIAEAREKEERRRQEEEKRRQEEEKRRQEEEARQTEKERLAALERQKQLEIQRALEEERKLEQQRQEEASTIAPNVDQNQPDTQTLSLARNKQLHRQHLEETTHRIKHRNRVRQQRPRINQQPPTTTPPPSPNQPPLSVYMGGDSMAPDRVKIADVLRILKDAKTIAVLDTVVPNIPKVFVGPTNLDPPAGYTKFDLPYLSSIDHNRVERKVDKLPFFVAPLSFDPPPGYSKIPFPAPHIGSVVVNTIDASSPEPDTPEIIHNPSPTPLIEPNSYIDGTGSNLGRIDPTTLSYEHSTTAGYTQELSSTPKYDTSYSTISNPGGSRFRFRQSYGDNNPPSVIDTIYRDESSIPTGKSKQKAYYNEDSRPVAPNLAHETRLGGTTATAYQEEAIYSSTPNYPEHSLRTLDDPLTKEQDLAGQLALINHELAKQRDANNNNKNSFVEHQNTYTQSEPHLINSFQPLLSPNDVNEVRESVGLTQYNLPAELPISPHLPGLVNSLLEKQTTIPTTTTTHVVTTPAYTKATTTTTTARPPSTTYRPRSRHRSRIVPTRPTTTTTPTTSITRTTADRSRRPYSRTRSGSRYTTTTESYNDSTAYEPTKSKNSGTTEKYNYADHHKRQRGQKHRHNDKMAYQSEAYDQNYNVQAHQAATYEHTAPDESITSSSTDPYSQPGSTSHNSNQQESSIPLSNLNAFSQENYSSTSISSTENYPPPRETTTNYNTPVASEDYSKSQNYPQNYPQEANYPIAYGSQLNDLDQSVLEKAPVNGFNYQAQNSETRNQPTVQKSKDYTAYYAEKLDNTDFGISGTSENPGNKIDKTTQQYSPIYDVAPVQSHSNYPLTGDNGNFGQVEDRKVDESSVVADPNEEPIFIPLPPEKQQVYDLLTPSTEEPLNAMVTQTSTTTESTPVVIRQRVRGRVGTRTHSDSVIQTRPKESQDEYVRFSAVNHQDSPRSSNVHRHRTKSRSRPQSQVKTSGYEYVKIQAGTQRQRPFVQQTTPSTTIAIMTTTTTTTTPRTTTTTTTEQPLEEDIDYGFIRPPSFRPVNPVDNRFHAPPVTFKPILPQVNNLPIQQQPSGSAQEIEIEYDPPPSHSLKNRPKYHTTNRRPLIKSTILPITTPITTTTTENIPPATLNPDNSVYTVRPKYKPEDIKQNRSRSRTRRPGGRKRVTTTSTTESGFDANNEVPLEGNYPRVLPSHPAAIREQQTLYDENFGSLSQFGETYQPDQNYKPATENYPPQDFVLNFGVVSPQTQLQQEEYDQTQLASNTPQKYDHSTHSKSTILSDSQVMPADIYGAESQWSTKLSRTSFQPSFAANYATDEFKEAHTKDGNVKEVTDIITVRPENSVTYVVSSELENSDETKSIMSEEESMIKATTVFGQKMIARDHTENPMKRQQKVSLNENVDDDDDKWRSKEDNLSREPTDNEDGEKIPKKTTNPVAVRKTNRRKRVRVRVRPIVDDFVTAESQHINAAVNSLTHDQYKYNPIRQTRPNLGEFSITRSTNDGSRRSVLQDFLEEMLKTDEVPVLATSTSTVLPLNVWQTSTPITSSIEEEEEEKTTNYKFSRITTNIPTTSEELEGTRDPEESLRATTQYYGTRIYPKDSITKDSTENIQLPTSQETETTSNDFNNSQTTLNDLNSIHTALETTPITDKLETTTIKPIDTTIEDSSIVDNTKTEESRDNDDISYLKNHRAKWSEVRYPSDPSIALNHSLFSTWNYDKNKKTADWSKISTKDTANKEEKDTEIKILSDYVPTVFDDLKGTKENNKERFDEKSLNKEKNNKVGTSENSSEDNNVKTNSPLEDSTISVKKEISQVEDRSTTKLEKEETPTTIVVQNIDDNSVTSGYHSNPTVIFDTTMHDILSKDESMVTVTPTSLITTTTTTTTTTKPTIPTTSEISQHNTTETILGKVLRTSTTTKVSHMTEICYRGRCVMTKPDREIRLR
ncbi:PREDICTED: mucin-3A [Polistes dominula]|uniref:Mucin-3A n=1 Tax=Polistes dominula TaxID=743375 RepID=A0ABM1I4Z0_POLDO|nr:PREDICTED: mucin-3A [Polistes dominula]